MPWQLPQGDWYCQLCTNAGVTEYRTGVTERAAERVQLDRQRREKKSAAARTSRLNVDPADYFDLTIEEVEQFQQTQRTPYQLRTQPRHSLKAGQYVKGCLGLGMQTYKLNLPGADAARSGPAAGAGPGPGGGVLQLGVRLLGTAGKAESLQPTLRDP
jgi:hypothetical protein